MNKLTSTVLLLLFTIGIPIAKADDRHHPENGDSVPKQEMSQGMGMGMMDMTRMQGMQQMMERIHKTDDPADRQRLMHEHMDQMHKMMGDMRSMMGAGMMMQGKSDGMMGQGRMEGMPMEQCHQMMVKRMDMMQGMMEQMMEYMKVQQDMQKQGDVADK